MADRTSSRISIDAAPEEIMRVIGDFAAYPEWAGQVKSAEVLETGDDGRPAKVRFVLDAGVISDTYALGYEWADDSVRWRMVEEGTMLSGLTGAYLLAPRDLDPRDGRTEVTYELTVDLKIPMIGMIKRKAEKIIIDTALKGLKKRVEAAT